AHPSDPHSFPTRRSSDLEVDLCRNCARTQSSLAFASIRSSKVESGHDSREPCLSHLALPISAQEEFAFCVPARRRFSMPNGWERSEEHTSELQSPYDLVC